MNELYDTLTQEYLEVIGRLEKSNRVARVKDIATLRGVTRSSVSTALTTLGGKKLIQHEQYGHVTLTSKGRKIAKDLEQRHQSIRSFLMEILGIPLETADEDACKIEHIISHKSLTALSHFLDFVQKCPKNNRDYLKYFTICGHYQTTGTKCDHCSL